MPGSPLCSWTMNIDDLEWQVQNYGGLPPRTVELLLEGGHLTLVIRAAAERGEWFCAEAAVRELCKAEEFEQAWAVMEPFVAIGWRPAVWASAEILLQWGRVDEALALVRPDETGLESGDVCRDFAELLTKAGRVDEAINILEPHIDESWLLSALVAMTDGQARDQRVLELIAPRADGARRAREERRWDLPYSNAPELQARVLERAGQADEAIRLLGEDVTTDRYFGQDTVTLYAELLARHGRIEELRALSTGAHANVTLAYYTKALENLGEAPKAEAVLREFIQATDQPDHRWTLIDLLHRQGRTDEALEVGQPTFDHDDTVILESTLHLLVVSGRTGQALELLDERSAKFIEEHSSWLTSMRLWLLGENGQYPEALSTAAAVSPDKRADFADLIARLMEQSGRVDEAINLLLSTESCRPWEVAELLIRHGRPAAAITGMPAISVEHERARQREAARDAARSEYGPPF